MADDPDEPITIRLDAGIWSGIDGGMDNAGQDAIDLDDQPTQLVAQEIREAGWAQVPWVDGAWPPMDQIIAITLTRAQWRFALNDALDSQPIYESLGDGQSVQLCEAAIRMITEALG